MAQGVNDRISESAAMPAVSNRRTLALNEAARQPASANCARSSGSSPPSGPSATANGAHVRDGGDAPIRWSGDGGSLTGRRARAIFRRRSRGERRGREVGHRLGFELLDPLLRQKHRCRLAASRCDAARRVLETHADRHQPDRHDGRGHQHLRERETTGAADSPLSRLSNDVCLYEHAWNVMQPQCPTGIDG